MQKHALAAYSWSICVLTTSVAWAVPVTDIIGPFNVTFYNTGDSDGTRTGQADWTATQRADVAAAINVWDALIANTPARQVQLNMFWGDFGATPTLGSTTNSISGNLTNAYSRTERVWRDGVNVTPGIDAAMRYSTNAAGSSWNFGTGLPTMSQIDFRSVAAHEIGHLLGFTSTYGLGSPGGDNFWNGGITAWDSHLRDDAGNRPAPNSLGTVGNFNQLDNPVFFVGPNAVAVNGGNPVAVYAPTTYSSGSSLSHLNEATFPLDLMSPQIAPGQLARTPSDLDWAIMKDIGWTVVPEPSIVLLLSGCSGALLLRQRRIA